MTSSRGSPDPGVTPAPLASPALAGQFFTTTATWEAQGQAVQAQSVSHWAASKGPVQFSSVQSLSRVRLFATP